MGRKKKFGEESDFVSVRVPKSKRKEYRNAIKDFVEKKFLKNSHAKEKRKVINSMVKESELFRKFEEFIDQIKKEKNDQQN